jgi:tRNA(fMet)-specific endonuclease VapC
MARYLLDSDCLIDYANGVAPTVSLIRSLFVIGDELCLCDVVVAEVWTGLTRREEPQVAALIRPMTFLPASVAVAQQAGRWRFDYARQGVALATTDVLVASTAVANDATLITANHRHFPMPELSLLPLPR